MSERERYEVLSSLYDSTGKLDYLLAIFGEEIAKREGYKFQTGMEAVQFYLVNKYAWLPRDVKSMSNEDIRFLLAEEMTGWTPPTEALIRGESRRKSVPARTTRPATSKK